MKIKNFAVLPITLMCMALSIFCAYAKTDYSALDYSELRGLAAENNTCGAYVYGFNGKTLYSASVLPSFASFNVTVDGPLKSVCQSGIYSCGLFAIDYKTKTYGVAKLNMSDGSCSTCTFDGLSSINVKSFGVSGDYFYFIRSDGEVNYISVYGKDGTNYGKISFDENVNSIFVNDAKVYANLSDGRIFRLDKTKSKLAVNINSCEFVTCAGADCIRAENATIYSLNGKSLTQVVSGEKYSVVYDNGNAYYLLGRTVLCKKSGGETVSFTVDKDVKFLFALGEKTAVVYEDFSMSAFSLSEFSSRSVKSDKIDLEKILTTVSPAFDIPSGYSVNSGGYLMGVESGLSVSAFKNKFSVDVDVLDKDGGSVTSGKIKSGYFVSYNTTVYVIAVKGDVTGEGNVKTNDVSSLMKFYIGESTFDSLQLVCADFNLDGKTDNKDLVLIAREADG